LTGLNVAGVREGDVLAGKYRVDRVLGVGGMGVVVAAHHIGLDERVAIKFLLPEVLDQGEAVARFAREARAAVKIKSEHVAKVTDVGKLENGAPYMVMEYLEGSDLSAWLAERGALPFEQAVEFVLQACEAIAEAHALGIVHRDLKPGNLFVTRRPDGMLSVKVLDFGISKMTGMGGSSGPAMTRTSALMGSPLYMSPEQMQSSRDVDARSDIWALGVILYELVSGTPPFAAETMTELVLRVVQGAAPTPLRHARRDAPPGLEQVIFRCLERDRARRYESIGTLAVALLPYGPKHSKISVERISGVLRSAGLSATALGVPPSSDSGARAMAAGTAASWGTTAATKARGPWLAVGGVGLALALAGIGWGLTHGAPAPAASALAEVGTAPKAPAATQTLTAPAVVAPTPTVTSPPPATPTVVAMPAATSPLPSAATSASAPLPASHAPAHAKAARTLAAARPASPAAPPAPPHPAEAAPATAHPADAAPPRPAPRPAEDKPNIFDERK
jgi:serine/threonine-protein kinase